MRWIVRNSSGMIIHRSLFNASANERFLRRLKKVQGKKKRVAAEKAAANTAEDGDERGTVEAPAGDAPDEGEVTGDLLGTKDDDVIF